MELIALGFPDVYDEYLLCGCQQIFNRRVVASRRAFEMVGDLALRHNNHGTTKLQRMPL